MSTIAYATPTAYPFPDPKRPDWQERSACIGHDPDLWFPEPGERNKGRRAIAICRTCPVKDLCLDENKDARYGIFGGLTAGQRTRTPQVAVCIADSCDRVTHAKEKCIMHYYRDLRRARKEAS